MRVTTISPAGQAKARVSKPAVPRCELGADARGETEGEGVLLVSPGCPTSAEAAGMAGEADSAGSVGETAGRIPSRGAGVGG